jgi:hypothetical protein
MGKRIGCALVFLCAATVWAAEEADLSSPTETIKSLAKAVNAGDAPRAKKCVEAHDRIDNAVSSAGISYVIAMQKLKKTIDEKFGEGSHKQVAELVGDQAPAGFIDQIVDYPDTIKETVDNETAQIKVGEVDLPMKKIEGEWKIDGDEMMKDQSAAEKLLAAALFAGPAKLMTDLTKELTDGKYKDADEFKTAFKERLEVVKKKATSQPAK